MIAHILISSDGHIKQQTVLEHLNGVAEIARQLGEPLGRLLLLLMKMVNLH